MNVPQSSPEDRGITSDAVGGSACTSPDSVFKDWQKTTDILFGDVQCVAEQVEHSGDGFVRRNYVRAVLAAIEGSTFGMKRLVLQICKKRQSRLTTHDMERLLETVIDKQGRPQKRFLRFGDNIKFTFGVFAKVHGCAFVGDYRSENWMALLKAAEIRHRLMHPKASADLDVSDSDLDLIRHGNDWYFTTRNRLLGEATRVLERYS